MNSRSVAIQCGFCLSSKVTPILRANGPGRRSRRPRVRGFGTRTVIKQLSFELHAGETLAVIGPNGAGKTALLRALLHMLSFDGSIEWAEDARIGYVPQKVDADRELPLHISDLLNAKLQS
jgi:ABC-type Mn2+/Zn2+ transport system ATPase subunit